VVAELTPRYGGDCPVAVVARATWPDERIVRGTLADIRRKLATETIERTAVILVGPRIGGAGLPRERALRPVLSPSLSGRGRP
jgi:precorrin-4/cobalt-precorrin-4 C11-methyltransferase